MEMIIDGEVLEEIITSLTEDYLSKIQWRTRDEGLIYIKDMEDKHLRNSALFLCDFGYQRCIMPEHRRLVWLRIFKMEWERRMRAKENGNKRFRIRILEDDYRLLDD